MPALGEYVNVHDSALEVLRAKGYQVWYRSSSELFCAERDGWDFMAENPVSLLGLVAMYEFRQPERYTEYWWRRPGDLDHRSLPEHPRPYRSVVERRTP